MRLFQAWTSVLLVTTLSACGHQLVGWPLPDGTAPTVTSTSPEDDALGVARNAAIIATFSEPMDPATLTDSTVTLMDGATPIPASVGYTGVTVYLAPDALLDPDRVYTVTIAGAVTDVSGNEMGQNYGWTFTTGGELDMIAPLVISTVPDEGATSVATNAALTAAFSEPMDPASLDASSFTLKEGARPVPGVVSHTGATASFDPDQALEPGTTYVATITTGATDLAGNPLAQDYSWSFATGLTGDDVPPTVVFTHPEDGAGDIRTETLVTAVFSEAMAPLTVTTASFTVVGPSAAPVAGAVVYDPIAHVGRFTALSELLPDTTYTARVDTTAADLAGNGMVADHVWTFTTEPGPDTTPPFVVLTQPEHLAADVRLDAELTAAFSEAMTPATLTVATFTVTGPGGLPVPGAVRYDGVAQLATFTPVAPLLADTAYTATIDQSASDLTGDTLAADYVWTFTTREGGETIRPYVVLTNPADLAADVALGAWISAAFSEPMDPSTLVGATFTVTGTGAVPVPGAALYDPIGQVAVFTPVAPLQADTTYTATIDQSASDLAGNTLLADYVWTFTTREGGETVRPYVVLTNPADLAADVALGARIFAAFSEPMDPSTVDSASFTVTGPGAIPVLGAAVYDPIGQVAVFTPAAPLLADTTYTATVDQSASDLAGNTLIADYTWTFTTRAGGETIHPYVVLTNPADLATDVMLDAWIAAAFSEPMDPSTVDGGSFTVTGPGTAPVVGAVSYNPLTLVATFAPDGDLLPDTTYAATLTTDSTDLAGNPLLADYVWTFTTRPPLDEFAPTVIATSPLDLAIDVPLDSVVEAAFSEAMDLSTVSEATFEVAGPGSVTVTGVVGYDPVTLVATFFPDTELLQDTTYTATITTGAADLAGNPLAADYVWTFTTPSYPTGLLPVDLRSLETFVAVAGAGLTNSNSSGTTTLNGDVGLSPTGTCIGDGLPCTLTNPVINGTLYANDPDGVAAQAKIDLTSAYIDAVGRPPGVILADPSGLTLPPGVYTSASTMTIAVGGTVILDGQGNPNAVWIFQIGSSLTVNNNAQILLVNGARAKNVFWAAFASSTLGNNVSFQGTVLAGASNSVGTDSVVVGRLLCTTGQITLLSNNITLPPL